MSRDDLRQTSGDYAAGDLDPDETAAFEAMLASSPELQREVQFWREMEGALKTHGRPAQAHAPGPGFNEVLRRRLVATPAAPLMAPLHRRWPQWLPGLTAGLAAGLLLVVGLNMVRESQGPRPLAWSDSGAVTGSTYLGIDTARSGAYFAGNDSGARKRCWAGLWTTAHHGTDDTNREISGGVRVVRVVEGGPAHLKGVYPGSVILSVDGESIRCPRQLATVLGSRNPGDNCKLEVYHPGRHEIAFHDVALGAVNE